MQLRQNFCSVNFQIQNFLWPKSTLSTVTKSRNLGKKLVLSKLQIQHKSWKNPQLTNLLYGLLMSHCTTYKLPRTIRTCSLLVRPTHAACFLLFCGCMDLYEPRAWYNLYDPHVRLDLLQLLSHVRPFSLLVLLTRVAFFLTKNKKSENLEILGQIYQSA
jgi:hypothetical protein